MQTFSEFVKNVAIEAQIKNVATLMVENKVDPMEFIGNYLENNHPILAEQWWKPLANWWTGLWDKGVGKTSRESDPMQHLNAAVQSLTALKDIIQNHAVGNPYLQDQQKNVELVLQNLSAELESMQKTADMVQPMAQGISQHAVAKAFGG